MDKSPDAFRTISEVAEALETPAHVLRFWESRFPQIKPVKRAGGRRYYRPVDVALLGGIRHLLHDEGMTIRGVQKILREQGVRHVASLAPNGDLSDFDAIADDDDLVLNLSVSGEDPVAPPDVGQVVALAAGPRRAAILPDTPAAVVQLHAPAEPPTEPEFARGFLLPTANHRPLPSLGPVTTTADDAPEAGHVWVEVDEPTGAPLFPVEAAVWALEPVDDPDTEHPPDTAAPLFAAEAALRDLDDPDGPDDADPAPAETPELDLVPQAIPHDLTTPLASEPVHDAATAFNLADPVGPALAGVASRLRALPRPVSPRAITRLTELHKRLGLLRARMIEAARVRR